MSRVLFIRHAETEMAGRFCGHSDPDLNAQGRMQLARVDPACSPRSRSIPSIAATCAAPALPRKRLRLFERYRRLLRPALREIDFGQWEGLSWEQIEQMDPEYARKWMARYPHLPAPSGESFQAFEARVLEEVNRLLDGNRGPIAVVTHGGVLRVVLRHLCGCSDEEAWQQTRAYCCIVRYE